VDLFVITTAFLSGKKKNSQIEYLDQKWMKMDDVTRGWRQLQVPSVALHCLLSSSDGIAQSTEGEFDGRECGTRDTFENE
jgi:hypothetical protein